MKAGMTEFRNAAVSLQRRVNGSRAPPDNWCLMSQPSKCRTARDAQQHLGPEAVGEIPSSSVGARLQEVPSGTLTAGPDGIWHPASWLLLLWACG